MPVKTLPYEINDDSLKTYLREKLIGHATTLLNWVNNPYIKHVDQVFEENKHQIVETFRQWYPKYYEKNRDYPPVVDFPIDPNNMTDEQMKYWAKWCISRVIEVNIFYGSIESFIGHDLIEDELKDIIKLFDNIEKYIPYEDDEEKEKLKYQLEDLEYRARQIDISNLPEDVSEIIMELRGTLLSKKIAEESPKANIDDNPF